MQGRAPLRPGHHPQPRGTALLSAQLVFPDLGQILMLATWLGSLLTQAVGALCTHLGFRTHASVRGRSREAGVVSYSTEHRTGDAWALGGTGKLTSSNRELVGRAGPRRVSA